MEGNEFVCYQNLLKEIEIQIKMINDKKKGVQAKVKIECDEMIVKIN